MSMKKGKSLFLVALGLIFVFASGFVINYFIRDNFDINRNITKIEVESKDFEINNINNEFITIQEKIFDENNPISCKDCNIILISLTNTRKDHIGLYGYERNTTPNIDKFFKDSLIFKNTFAPASWTLPVAVSLYTSLFPYSHGVVGRYIDKSINKNILTLPEILKNSGYKTAAFTGGGDYNRKFGLDRGIDDYYDDDSYNKELVPSESMSVFRYLGTKYTLPPAINWIKNNYKDKFFIHIQGYDTHCPFTPTKPFDTAFGDNYQGNIDFSDCIWSFKNSDVSIDSDGKKYWMVHSVNSQVSDEAKFTEEDLSRMMELYDGEILEADNNLAELFKIINELNLDKNTIVIFMSEHGDLFGEHGRFMRGGPLTGTFYQPVLNFPLAIKIPNMNEKKDVESLFQTVDLMPTLLDFLKIEDGNFNQRQGKSIKDYIFNDSTFNEYAYGGSIYTDRSGLIDYSLSDVRVIRNEEWEFISEKGYINDRWIDISKELYNLKNDPKEIVDIYDTNINLAKNLESILNEKIDSLSIFD